MDRDQAFVSWYQSHGRQYPWRHESVHPFHIMITEVLLRQTNADLVASIWPRFFNTFTCPGDLLQLDIEDLFQQISVLGLGRQRTLAIRQICTYLEANHQGEVPNSLRSLHCIPHIGVYSANAILCFAFGAASPIVDSNVIRILSRLYDIDAPLDNRRVPAIWEIARTLLPKERSLVKQHNYGLLDLAGEICTARTPNCFNCPLIEDCPVGQQRMAVLLHDAQQADWLLSTQEL